MRPTSGVLKVISVTKLLTWAGYIDTRWYSEAGRVRGTIVHDLARRFDRGEIPLVSFLSCYRAWLLQYEGAVEELNRPTWIAIEQLYTSPALGLRGVVDRTAWIGPAWAVLDIKTGLPQDWHGLQLALYRLLAEPIDVRAVRHIGVYLTEDAYEIVEFADRRDEARDVLARYIDHVQTRVSI
tara:strand:- start:437 stop:982 length:546 start_codon:yes stop_codon:yes gene_type:complete